MVNPVSIGHQQYPSTFRKTHGREMTSNSNPSDPLGVAILDFQATLTPTQRSSLLKNSTKPDAISILSFTAEIDKLNASRRARCVSSRLFGILESVQGFSNIVDTLVSSYPQVAALVWGSLKFTILAASNVTSFFDKLSECFLHLGCCFPRYSEYERLFGVSIRLQKSLCAFFTTIINFCTKAVQALESPGATLTQALWRPFEKEFGPFESELRKRSKDVKDEIKLASEIAAANERVSQAKERALQAKERKYTTLFRTEARQDREEALNRALQRVEQKKKVRRRKLLDKLSSYDHVSALKRIRKRRHSTTSSWFRKSRDFQNWLEHIKPSVLLLTGILGSGKSVVTAAVIDDLLCQPQRTGDHFAFFFCESDNTISLTGRIILGSLLRQCLSADTLSQEVEDQLAVLFEGTFYEVDEMLPIFEGITAGAGETTFVIDGIDECSQPERASVLKILRQLISCPGSTLKIFFSSREGVVEDIHKIFETYQQLEMNCEEANADIAIYITDAIEQKIEGGDLFLGDPRLKHEICDALIKGANGMFLWAAFQISSMCRQACDADIRKSLAALPRGLPETFEQRLLWIVKEGNAKNAEMIFRWIAAAKRPLSPLELREAIAIEATDEVFQQDRLANNIPRMVSSCGDLVVWDDEESIVQFAHHSVKTFLLSESKIRATDRFHFQLSEADHTAGEICVAYLNLNDFRQQLAKVRRAPPHIRPADIVTGVIAGAPTGLRKHGNQLAKLFTRRPKVSFNVIQQMVTTSTDERTGSFGILENQHPFLTYVGRFWLSHTIGFTRTNTNKWSLWKKLVLGENPLASKPWMAKENGEAEISLMSYILHECHLALLSCYLEPGNYLEHSFNTRYMLLKASERGITSVVDLITSFADHEALIINHCLQVATEGGHLDIVDRLLTAKADVNAAPAEYGGRTALQAAAGGGHLDIVDRLLTAKADVNAAPTGYGGRTALEAAAEGGHLDIVERLKTSGVW